ncbi:MAG: helix-turn-helix transcriptional regulator [Bacteroidales bacterium]|nr:helix-turn-helix transcriptional regulator [Candidatus Liminaster caballi]
MNNDESLAKKSTTEAIWTLGERFRTYRIACQMTQKEVSEISGVSLLTIRRFELGITYNITLSNLIALLKSIDMADGLDELLPPMPISPYALSKLQQKQPKRVRHGK